MVVVPATVKFPEIVTFVGSPILILLFDTVVSISFAVPSKVRVSPVLKVSFDPLSAASVKLVFTAEKDRLPEPSVVRNCPLVTVPGSV